MNYLGSKNRYAKYIAPIIQKYIDDNKITTFVDIFCGGANLVDKIICDNVIANDLSPTLIAIHKKMQQDKDKIPTDGLREWWDKAYTEYKRLMKDYPIDAMIWQTESSLPLWEIGAIEWYASFSTGGFKKGYAKNSETRNYYNERLRCHKKQSENPLYNKINFQQGNYLTIEIPKNAVIYADPPYKSTTSYQINPKFNHEEFYNWCREKSKTNPIFISEQFMPDDFKTIWSKDDCTRTCGLDNSFKACERLFFIDERG